jgi:hypothetical protein
VSHHPLENDPDFLAGHPLPGGLWVRVQVNAKESFLIHLRDRAYREYLKAIEGTEINNADDVHSLMLELVDDWNEINHGGGAEPFTPDRFRSLMSDRDITQRMMAAIVRELGRRAPALLRRNVPNLMRPRHHGR